MFFFKLKHFPFRHVRNSCKYEYKCGINTVIYIIIFKKTVCELASSFLLDSSITFLLVIVPIF